jgi:hypothetical protein
METITRKRGVSIALSAIVGSCGRGYAFPSVREIRGSMDDGCGVGRVQRVTGSPDETCSEGYLSIGFVGGSHRISQAAWSGGSLPTPGREDFPVMRTSRPLWTSLSAMALAAAELLNRFPQSLKGRLVVTTVEARR